MNRPEARNALSAEMFEGLYEALPRLANDPAVRLVVLTGPAAGAGLSLALALACDMRIASEDAKLTTAFSKIGLSGDFGGS
jgi:2-(1,2-epoxy-1,2-dihydrophenyl)acetyl-CoA isomerase